MSFESACVLKSLHRIEAQVTVAFILMFTIIVMIFIHLKNALINSPGFYIPAITALVNIMHKLNDKSIQNKKKLDEMMAHLNSMHSFRVSEDEKDSTET